MQASRLKLSLKASSVLVLNPWVYWDFTAHSVGFLVIRSSLACFVSIGDALAFRTEVKAQGSFKLSTFRCLSAPHQCVTRTCLSSFRLYTSISQPWCKHHVGGTRWCCCALRRGIQPPDEFNKHACHRLCWWHEASLQVPFTKESMEQTVHLNTPHLVVNKRKRRDVHSVAFCLWPPHLFHLFGP